MKTNMIYCNGKNCSKKDHCANYIVYIDNTKPATITDYSVSGLGYSNVDENGNYYLISKSDCGDESDNYQYFVPKFAIKEETINVRQISQNICQLFEKVLDKHNIDIPDPDREISEEDSSLAHIYGVTYFNLEDDVTEILTEFANKIKRSEIKLQTDTY